MAKVEWTVYKRFGWNNWTFGVWWIRNRNRLRVGLDLGPFEVWWRREVRRG